MIAQTKARLKQLMDIDLCTPDSDLRDFKTTRIGDWENVPILEQPTIGIAWGGVYRFLQHDNPKHDEFEIHLIVKCTEPLSRNAAEDKLERLLYNFDADGDWGIIPWLRSHRSIQLSPIPVIGPPFTILITPTFGETMVEQFETDHATASTIIVLRCESQR